MNGIKPCGACKGDGFVFQTCGCREAACPHMPIFGVRTGPEPGLYMKFWVRRTDGSSQDGEKHANCDYLVLDWMHDRFAVAAGRAYAAACEAEFPDLAVDLRARADEAEKRWKRTRVRPGIEEPK